VHHGCVAARPRQRELNTGKLAAGDKVIVPAPATRVDAENASLRVAKFGVSDWYISKKKLAAAEKS